MEELKIEGLEKPKRKGTVLNIIFLILLLVAIGALINSTITIIKYKDMLVNPLGYSLDKFEIATCNCIDNSGKNIIIDSISYNSSNENIKKIEIPIIYAPPTKLNLSIT